MKNIILASGSPRRKQLLKQIGLKFEVVVSDVDEKISPKYKPHQQVKILSFQKAKAVAKKHRNSIVIGADTIVVLGKEVIGKPKDEKDAQRILKKLSGTQHSAITGFTIIDTDSKKQVTKSVATKLWLRKLTDQEIKRFVEKEKPYDFAGAYAIHKLASIFVKKIEGDFFGTVGLPLYDLTKELKKFGVEVL